MDRVNSLYSIHTDIDVPGELQASWQTTVNLIAETLHVPAGLVMRLHPDQIEVFLRSENEENVYEQNEKASLGMGLYCERVIDSQRELLVPNALADPAWDHNPDIELGMISYLGLPLNWPDGRVFGTICVLDNRTNAYSLLYRKLIEQFRDSIQSGLQTLYEKKVLVDAQRAVSLAMDSAKAANRAKSDFIANMSHEFRTPMNAIIGLTDLMLHDAHTPQQADRLHKIETASSHLLSILNDILDISKIEAGKFQLEKSDFDLRVTFEHLRTLISGQARTKGLGLVFDTGNLPLWLRGDATRILQALLNYTSNAIKFTEHGVIAVRAALLEELEDGFMVRFEVQDAGCGISPDGLSRLFEAFERAPEPAATRQAGTGLGLTITRHLAKLMGGHAGVTSEPGVGSTFWFTARLEAAQGTRRVAAPIRACTEAQLALQRRHAGARILLADDDEVNIEVASEMLRRAGLSVSVAVNGSEAVDMVARDAFRLVLMDAQMPEMDGLAATRAIRALPARKEIPILAMTADIFGQSRQDCHEAGMNDFIGKPFSSANLYAALLKWLPVVVDDPVAR